jgi:hypothetical protein
MEIEGFIVLGTLFTQLLFNDKIRRFFHKSQIFMYYI